MQVIPYARPLSRPLPSKESGILFGCGVVLVVFGALTAAVGVSASLFALRQGPGPTPATSRAAATLLLTIAASATMICTGVGSIRLRRWSRAVVLCVCG